MPAGSPLTQARRIAADSCPPDWRWLKPTGSALTHARLPPLTLAPWIKSTCHGQECRVSVLLCPQEHFKEPGLVLSMETRLGQAAPLVVAMEAILAACPLSLIWRRSLRDPQKKPRRSLSLQASPGGLLVPVAVLSCLSGPGGLSCRVLYCPVCLAPEGSWYPLTSPGKFFGGVVSVPAVGARPRGPRPWPRRPSAMASRAPSSAMVSRAPSPAMATWAPSSAMASRAPYTAMASRAPSSAMVPVCLFHSGGPRPVFLSVFVLRGLQSAPPPDGTVKARDEPFGRGE